jgi:hypothetical protein
MIHKRIAATSAKLKLPPYGATLALRLKFNNAPFLVVVCYGGNAWRDHEKWTARLSDNEILLMPGKEHPSNFNWPVHECCVVVDYSEGPSVFQVGTLVKALLRDGAASVTVWPSFVAPSEPRLRYQPGLGVVQTQEMVRTFMGGAQ